jgi:hypothetical protein
MTVRIYQPTKSAMQSGAGNSKQWVLAYDATAAHSVDPVMGWTGSQDTLQQLNLRFTTQEEAIAYAERNGLAYRIDEAKTTKRRTASYSDNFKFTRIGQWSH